MLLRDKVLVEKCINTLMWDYNRDSTSDINALQDLQLAFMDFLSVNTEEQVEYGIEYMFKEYKKEYDLLFPIIQEYKLYGFTGSLADLKPEEEEKESVSFGAIESIPLTLNVKEPTPWEKVKAFFKGEKAQSSLGLTDVELNTKTQRYSCITPTTTSPLSMSDWTVTFNSDTPELNNYWKEIIRKIWG